MPENPSLPHLAPHGVAGGSSSSAPTTLHPATDLPFTDAQVDEFREQDRWLPIANVARIMKTSLPSTAKVSKDAKECVQECVSEFISFITSEAAEKCLTEKRKTINGEDILTSLRALGFDNYEGVLKVYLAKFREAQMAQAKQKQLAADDEDGTGKRVADDDGPMDGRRKKSRARKKKALEEG